MWQDKIKEIIYLLENSSVNEIDVRFWGRRFRVVKSPSVVAGGNGSPAITNIVPPTDQPEAPTVVSAEKSNPGEASEKVLSPMPGTFYAASSPESDPFIKEGDQVVKGDTLCIIEAMKIMNEIEAESNGVIKKILIQNGAAVEYNQPLFLIEPS
ncbi:MAG: acetyl-CoA carboxylase biotin carboxyl carrier protein [Candidatus Marinimicrobia bacterium]|nr:acetyl-CoA carboxylase biotin carboxyl carrier protein [Candidatus Neomarinimicrobiota bacterium]MBL7059709.1 acetyl-CoA carboxylase biotin carboxyl carrier protein [Candidatus Neomarinimicrobiota bacterium]